MADRNALRALIHAAAQLHHAGRTGRRYYIGLCSGNMLQFSVEDSGPGITHEKRLKIFEPFFTTKGQGTGLGLAIALGVARAHGGTIEVRSSPGEGSEFVMELPAGVPANTDGVAA